MIEGSAPDIHLIDKSDFSLTSLSTDAYPTYLEGKRVEL